MTKEELKPVGTKAVVTEEYCNFEIGTEVAVVQVDGEDDEETYKFTDGVESWWLYNGRFEWVEDTKVTTSSGGPTKYYDMPFNDWVTGNDMMEYLAEHKWGKFGIHLKDIFKSTLRWGEKEGTTVEYDTRKIIYYGCRILRMIGGVEEVRKTLQGMLDDPQFSVTRTEEYPNLVGAVQKSRELFGDQNDEVVTSEEPAVHRFKVGDRVYISKRGGVVMDRFVGKVGIVQELIGTTSQGQARYNILFGETLQVAWEDDDGLILVEPVTYDFDKMLDHEQICFDSSSLLYKFLWDKTPQGWDFWDKVGDGLIEESVWKPILSDMEMQYEEYKESNK